MANLYEQISTLLSTTEFQNVLKNDILKIGQLNAIIAILIQSSTPFSLIYSPATKLAFASAVLTISINPSSNLQFTVLFN